MFNSKIDLVAVSKERDADGYAEKAKETKRAILAEIKSPTRYEFYKSMEQGFKTDFIAKVNAVDYEGEKLLSYEGKRYRVEKIYKASERLLELTCAEVV